MSPDKQKKINEKFSILEKALATGANQDVLSSAIKEYGIALSEGIS